jgi:hypothetical protein
MISEPIVSSIQLLTTFGSWAIRDSEIVIPEGKLLHLKYWKLEIVIPSFQKVNYYT